MFEIISKEQWECDNGSSDYYDNITIPRRMTTGSAGYDFFAPFSFTVATGKRAIVPTGIRVAIEECSVLLLFPRSSLGIKKGLMLSNTVGVVDYDYYGAENEGHIMAAFTNISDVDVTIKAHERFMQGVVVPFGYFSDEISPEQKRVGGIGSTNG